MKPTSVRLTDAELGALQRAAATHNTTVGALLRKAAILMANKLGAPQRTDNKGRMQVTINLQPADIKALTAYAAADDNATTQLAALHALRVGLVERGFLTMEPNSFPDAMSALAALQRMDRVRTAPQGERPMP